MSDNYVIEIRPKAAGITVQPASSCAMAAGSGSLPRPTPSTASRASLQEPAGGREAALRQVTAGAPQDRARKRIEPGTEFTKRIET